MSQRKAENTKSKSGRKKLSLSKETLKDLTAKGRVQGGGKIKYTDPPCQYTDYRCSF